MSGKSVYAGVNVISGSMNDELQGDGVLVYQDNDYDDFGDDRKLVLTTNQYKLVSWPLHLILSSYYSGLF